MSHSKWLILGCIALLCLSSVMALSVTETDEYILPVWSETDSYVVSSFETLVETNDYVKLKVTVDIKEDKSVGTPKELIINLDKQETTDFKIDSQVFVKDMENFNQSYTNLPYSYIIEFKFDKKKIKEKPFLITTRTDISNTERVELTIGTDNMIETQFYNASTYNGRGCLKSFQKSNATTNTDFFVYTTNVGGYHIGQQQALFRDGDERQLFYSNDLFYTEYATDTGNKVNFTFYNRYFKYTAEGVHDANFPTGLMRTNSNPEMIYSSPLTNGSAFTSGGLVVGGTKGWTAYEDTIQNQTMCLIFEDILNNTVGIYTGLDAYTPYTSQVYTFQENIADGFGSIYYLLIPDMPLNDSRDACIRHYNEFNTPIAMPNNNTGTITSLNGFTINTTTSGNLVDFKINSDNEWVFIESKFDSDEDGETIYFYNGTATDTEFVNYVNETGDWICKATTNSSIGEGNERCNMTDVYTQFGRAIAVWDYSPSGVDEEIWIGQSIPDFITTTITAPANATYYDNNQDVVFSFVSTSFVSTIDRAECFINNTSIGEVLNNTVSTTPKYWGYGNNYLNVTCVNGTNYGTDEVYFDISDFERTSYNHTSIVNEVTTSTFGLGFQVNTDLVETLNCSWDYNNTRIGNLGGTITNRSITYITPLTIINNTSHPIAYNCSIANYNGSIGYVNYTDTHNLIYSYNITKPVSENLNATAGEEITYTITGIEDASLANTIYRLNFNGTDYSATGSGTTHYYNKIMPIPNGFNATVSVYATLTTTYGGLRRNDTTPSISQVIYKPSFVNCTIGLSDYEFMTLGWYDEYNRTVLDFNTTQTGIMTLDFDVAMEDGTVIESSFGVETNSSTYTICFYPTWANFEYNISATYTSTGYVTRQYYLVNQDAINTTTRTVGLYNLRTSGTHYGRHISLNLKDENDNNVEGAIFNFLRWYPDDEGEAGTEEYVTMTRTDATGNAFTYIEYVSAKYRLIITKYGEILLTKFQEPFDPEKIGTVINYKITEGVGMEYFDFREIIGTYEINDTSVITFTVLDTSGAGMASAYFLVENLTSAGNYNIICEEDKTGIDMIVFYCPLGNYTNSMYHLFGTVTSGATGETYTVFNRWIDYRTIEDVFGTDGLFYAFLIIVSFGTAGIIYGPPGVLIGIISGLVLTSTLNLMILDGQVLMTLIAFLGVMIYLLIKKG